MFSRPLAAQGLEAAFAACHYPFSHSAKSPPQRSFGVVTGGEPLRLASAVSHPIRFQVQYAYAIIATHRTFSQRNPIATEEIN